MKGGVRWGRGWVCMKRTVYTEAGYMEGFTDLTVCPVHIHISPPPTQGLPRPVYNPRSLCIFPTLFRMQFVFVIPPSTNTLTWEVYLFLKSNPPSHCPLPWWVLLYLSRSVPLLSACTSTRIFLCISLSIAFPFCAYYLYACLCCSPV